MNRLVLLTIAAFHALAANTFAGTNSIRHIITHGNESKGPTTQLFHECVGANQGEPEPSRQITVEATGEVNTTLPLNENDVNLLELGSIRA